MSGFVKREKGQIWAGLLLSFLIVFFYPQFLQAQAISTEVCLSCHAVAGLEKVRGGKSVSLSIGGKAFLNSVHGPLGCTTCHSDISQVPHAAELKRVECALCHADAARDYSQSVHGRAKAKGDRDVATCSNCHGKHVILPAANPNSKVYALNLPRTCGSCHGDPELAKRHQIPVANAYQLYMDSIHGRGLLKAGLLVAANCSSCHGSHGILPASDPKSPVHRTNIPESCGRCHAGILRIYADSVHGKAVMEGNSTAPVCVNCHTAHEIRRVEMERWKLDVIQECGTCHAESLRTYRDTFHGQVTALGFTRVARCSDCHGSHDIFARSDARSLVAPSRIVTTCSKCHPKANARFTEYDPHADAADRVRNPVLYYTSSFMTWLLAGVFVFFGLHTVLWACRPVSARLIKKRRDEDEGDDPPESGGENEGEQEGEEDRSGG
jgi:DnaJ-class molecular chaperone